MLLFGLGVVLALARPGYRSCSGKKIKGNRTEDAIGSWGHEFAHRDAFRAYGLRGARVLNMYTTRIPHNTPTSRSNSKTRLIHGFQIGSMAGAAFQREYYRREGLRRPGWVGNAESGSDVYNLQLACRLPNALTPGQARAEAERWVRSNYGSIVRQARRKAGV